MKSILIRPSVTLPGGALIEKSYITADGDQSFDMLSYLTNEFENGDIRAEVIELTNSSAHLDLIRARASLDSLRDVAQMVMDSWEKGDLALAVRALDRALKECV